MGRAPRHEIPTNRTETIEEALENSLLSFLPLNSTELTEEVLEEAFCRDVESYSSVFQVELDDLHHRPSHCPAVEESHCAVLYDSGSCSGGWRLPVEPGEERQLLYWSSDYKYRNDADIVAVRNGCTFTGYMGEASTGRALYSLPEQRTGGFCSRSPPDSPGSTSRSSHSSAAVDNSQFNDIIVNRHSIS